MSSKKITIGFIVTPLYKKIEEYRYIINTLMSFSFALVVSCAYTAKQALNQSIVIQNQKTTNT